MTNELSPLEVLTSFPSEIEASMVVNVLESEGITAALTGANTAMFRTEAPGVVQPQDALTG